MTKEFCSLPWNHLVVGTSGTTAACCVWGGRLRDGASPLSVYDHSVEEIWNSAHMRELRRAMVEGDEIPECGVCYTADDTHGLSYRALKSPDYLDRTIEDYRREGERTGYRVARKPRFLKLDLGNLCNLKCRMCDARNSSQIARDGVHGQWSPAMEDLAEWTMWEGGSAVIGPDPKVGVLSRGFHGGEVQGGKALRWTNGHAEIDLPLTEGTILTGIRIAFHESGRHGQDLRIAVNGRRLFNGILTPSLDFVDLDLESMADLSSLALEIESSTVLPAGAERELGVPIEEIRLLRATPAADASSSPLVNSRFADGRLWFQQDDLLLGELLGDPANIDEILFTGGEPFLIPEFRKVLDHLIDSGEAGRIQLDISTNCSRADDALLERLAKFKAVHFSFSIDGTDAVYEYIRFPARWPKIREILKRYLTLPNAHGTAVFSLQAYNVLNAVDLCRFCDEIGIDFSLNNIVRYPEQLQLDILPRRAKEVAAERLRVYARTACRPVLRTHVTAIADYIEGTPDVGTAERLRSFMLFTNDLDLSRGQSIKKANRELYDLIVESGFRWTDETLYAEPETASRRTLGIVPDAGKTTDSADTSATAPGISVIIPTYRRPESLRRCLRSIVPQVAAYGNGEIVVVNDGSHDGAYQEVLDEFGAAVRYFPETVNRSHGGARNFGVAQARHEWIVFTDDDCVVPGGWLASLLPLLTRDCDAVGGFARAAPDERRTLVGDFVARFNLLPKPLFDRDVLICAPTAVMAIRRSVFQEIGGFDETFRVAAEDVDFSYRLRRAGHTLRVAREWYLYHETSQGLRAHMRRWRGYGFGAAQHTFKNGEPYWYEHRIGPWREPWLKRMRKVAVHHWKTTGHQGAGMLHRAQMSAVAVLTFGTFEHGWRKGYRQFERVHGPLQKVLDRISARRIAAGGNEATPPGPAASDTTSTVSVAVVVPTYRRPDQLAALLSTLAPQVRAIDGSRIVIVNDGSDSEAYRRAIQPYLDVVTYRALSRNLGIGGATAAGVQAEAADIYVFTDDDCMLPEDWLAHAVAEFDRLANVDVLAGRAKAMPDKRRKLVEAFTIDMDVVAHPLTVRGAIQCVVTGCLAVRGPVLARAGGFDSRMRVCADVNLTYRLRQAGARFRIDEDWFVYHDQEWSALALARRMWSYGYWHAVHVLQTGDLVAAATAPEQRLTRIPARIGEAFRQIERPKLAAVRPGRRRLYAALSLATSASWHLGGYTAQRHSSRRPRGRAAKAEAPKGSL